ncbi:MAG: hypothetical protein LBE18_08730, partial [Planctomycetaceae bacterium]|nr:hypothetical protein [Planctomycetaceae bacterium]
EENTKEKIKRKYTHWHLGFVGAMDLELRKTGCTYTFVPETQTISYSKSYSNYIDMIITIVDPSPNEENNEENKDENNDKNNDANTNDENNDTNTNEEASGLVACLQKFTLCEFKPPNVTLTIRDIDRLIQLGLQYYLDFEDKSISRADVAGLFVVAHYPRKALENLPEGWEIENFDTGIYTIRYSNFLTSIVVLPELEKETYNLLTNMKTNLPEEKIKKLIKEAQQYGEDNSWSRYLNLIFELNIDKGEIKMSPTLLEKIKKTPYGAEMLNKTKAEGKAEGIAEGETKGIAKGKAEDIIRVLTIRFGRPSAKLQGQIREVKNINELDELIDFSATCVSLGEFATAFN